MAGKKEKTIICFLDHKISSIFSPETTEKFFGMKFIASLINPNLLFTKEFF